MTQVGATPAGTDGADPAAVECWSSISRFAASHTPADLAEALTRFAALPVTVPQRPKFAAVLVVEQVRAGLLRKSAAITAAVALADIADADPDPLPDWPPASAVVRALDIMDASMHGRPGFDPHHALADIERFAAVVGEREPYRTMVDAARLAVRHQLAAADQSVGSINDLADEARRIAARQAAASPPNAPTSPLNAPTSPPHAPKSPLSARAEFIAVLSDAQAQAARGDVAGLTAAVERFRSLLDQLSPGDPLRVQGEQAMATLRPLLEMMRPGGIAHETIPGSGLGMGTAAVGEADAALAGLRAMAEQPGLTPAERAMRLMNLGVAEFGFGMDDPALLAQAIARLDEALAVASEHDPRRPFYLVTAGTTHLRRLEMTGDRASLARGIDLLEQARRAAGTTTHAYWTLATMPLAHAYRLSGRVGLGRSTAFSALRGHAWSALLQPDPAGVSSAARYASGDAIDVARWCLDDGDAAGAAAALDAGRGLTLYAATETRNLTTQLEARGEHRLAQQWQQAVARSGATEVPAELRRRVVSAVAGVPLDAEGSLLAAPAEGSTRLLDPVSLDEVRAALVTIGADALVYLVPGEEKSGAAVIVPACEEPSWLMLPELNNAEDRLTRLIEGMADAAQSSRSAHDQATTPVATPAATPAAIAPARDLAVRARRSLDDLCDWAWRVAIGPLLERGLSRPDGRPVRVVLVAMRELGLVPWHAARRRVSGRLRYAVEDAVFSYAPSARLLCEAAWAPHVPIGDGGLVVGDPAPGAAAPDLPAARAEALAIRSAYYPSARYVGRTADGTVSPTGSGTRQEVLDWFADPHGGGILHLACHGVIRTGVGVDGTSYLLLADGQQLTADELLRAATADARRPIALTALAACRSAAPTRGYDDAFSLSTSFLAAGIRSVVSAQWSVPDAPTSVLMFMFHHYLRHDGLRPADALRAAQLWMLSDDPEMPPTMPEVLRRHVEPGHNADIAAWAGFVHSGW